MYYLEDLREESNPPPPTTIPPLPPNEPLPAQKSSQDSELTVGVEKEEKEKEKKKEQNKADANPYGSKSKIDSKKDSQQP